MTNAPMQYVALHRRYITRISLAHIYSSIGIAQLQTILLCIGNGPNLLEVQPEQHSHNILKNLLKVQPEQHSHIQRNYSEFEQSSNKVQLSSVALLFVTFSVQFIICQP